MSPIRSLLTLALGFGLATATLAAPSFLGPTGLLITPNAETLAKDSFNASIHSFNGADTEEYAFNFGVRDGLEVGFSRLPDDNTVINAKYALQPETDKRVALSLGVIDLTDQTNTTLYAVAGKTFAITDLYGIDGVSTHVGLAGGDDDTLLDGLFAGASLNILDNRANLMVEYDSDSFNYGARFNIGKGFGVQAGFIGDNSAFAFGGYYTGSF